MARGLALGWGRPVLCTDVGRRRARRRWPRRSAARRWPPAPRSPSAPTSSSCATSPTSCTRWRPSWPRTPRPSSRSSPPRRCRRSRRPIPTAPCTGSLPSHAGRGAPGRGRPRRRRGAGRRARRGGARAVRGARHARRARRRARRRRHGPDVLRARLRRARRRGAGRRRRAPRDHRRPGRASSSCRRSRAPPSCCAAAATTRSRCAARSPRRAARPLAGWTRWSAAASAPLQRRAGRGARAGRAGARQRPHRSPTTCRRSFYVYGLLIFIYIVLLFFASGCGRPTRARRPRLRLPARHLRTLPAPLPPVHPAVRPARPEPHHRDHPAQVAAARSTGDRRLMGRRAASGARARDGAGHRARPDDEGARAVGRRAGRP